MGHFGSEGRVVGLELVQESDVVAECVRLRDRLWASATPHPEYTP
ncbi:DUF6879 family protein [Streptomyces sp. NPDC004610]